MIALRFMPGFAACAAICFAIAAPTNSLQAALKANSAKTGHHLDHLHQASHELKHAHSAVSGKCGQNGANAGKHVSAAIGHIEAAIQRHGRSLHKIEQRHLSIQALLSKFLDEGVMAGVNVR